MQHQSPVQKGSRLEGSVISLSLRGLRLKNAPPILPQFLCLTSLDVSENSLTSLEGIGQLRYLTVLNISRNMIAFLPTEIQHLDRLRNFDLRWNMISFLPKAFEKLPAMCLE